MLVAKENVLAQRGAYYPTVAGSISASRNRTSTFLAPRPNTNQFIYSLFTTELSVSYVPGVFGQHRRTMESLRALSEQARFALVATHNITPSANVAAADCFSGL